MSMVSFFVYYHDVCACNEINTHAYTKVFILFLFNNFIGAIIYFKIITTISTGPKRNVRTRLYRSPMQCTSLL